MKTSRDEKEESSLDPGGGGESGSVCIVVCLYHRGPEDGGEGEVENEAEDEVAWQGEICDRAGLGWVWGGHGEVSLAESDPSVCV